MLKNLIYNQNVEALCILSIIAHVMACGEKNGSVSNSFPNGAITLRGIEMRESALSFFRSASTRFGSVYGAKDTTASSGGRFLGSLRMTTLAFLRELKGNKVLEPRSGLRCSG